MCSAWPVHALCRAYLLLNVDGSLSLVWPGRKDQSSYVDIVSIINQVKFVIKVVFTFSFYGITLLIKGPV